ncbi:carboxypeptidase regulatory-like domain-containing protein [candidate division KSB1 bacterium]|nr:carboxypeptidase regulatory-like domain-containing protein [candidate division KSB1 bacterium]
MRQFRIITVIAAVFILTPVIFGYQIIIRPDEAVLEPGAGIQFHAQAFDRAHNPIAVREYKWGIAPAGLGMISNEGFFVAGQERGRGQITATAIIGENRFAGTATVTVGAPEQPQVVIKIEPENAIVAPGEVQIFKAIAITGRGTSLRKNSVRWTLDPKDLGEITATGIFTAGEREARGKIRAIVEIDNRLYRGETSLVVSTAPSAQILGKVTDEAGNPLTGAYIIAECLSGLKFVRRAVSNENGEYVLNRLVPGSYIIHAEMRGYLTIYYNNTPYLREATPLQIAENDSISGIHFIMPQGCRISGVVTDSTSGAALPRAIVNLVGRDNRCRRTTKSDSSGQYTFEGLPTGEYFVNAVLKGYAAVWYDKAKNKENAQPVLITAPEFVDGINFELVKLEPRGACIAGIVTDDSTGLPIEGAEIAVMPLSFARPRKGVSASDGTYEISGLLPGRYIVMCRAQDYIAEFYLDAKRWLDADPIGLQKEKIRDDIHFGLSPQLLGAYTISGTVIDESGKLLTYAMVSAQVKNNVVAAVATDENGDFLMPGLPAGSYQVTASCVSYQDGSFDNGRPISMSAGKSRDHVDICLVQQIPTGIENDISNVEAFGLEQNYPNPFNPVTNIHYSLPQTGYLELSIYNVLGHEIRSLFSGSKPAGRYSVKWNGTDDNGHLVSSGIYFYRLKTEDHVQIRRMILLK